MNLLRAPLRDACWRVRTVAGVERGFFWTVVLVTTGASGLSLLTGHWIVACLLGAGAVAILNAARSMMLEDPMALWIFWRTQGEQPSYRAVGRFDARPRARQLERRP